MDPLQSNHTKQPKTPDGPGKARKGAFHEVCKINEEKKSNDLT